MTTMQGWAEKLVAALKGDIRAAVATDPASALTRHFGLIVCAADSFQERGEGGFCDGASITEAGIVLYRDTPSRRKWFTLCHELGHHLVDQNDECLVWLHENDEPGRVLEQLCDTIASKLLIPQEERHRVFGARRPSALEFLDLYRSGTASRSACAIAVAEALPCPGFTLLISPDDPDRVFFGARTRDTRPYAWRGDPIPAGHTLATHQPISHSRSWWPYRDQTRKNMYMTVEIDNDGWMFAVFAENNLWDLPGGSFVDLGEDDRGYDGTVDCPCGYNGRTRMWPCSKCGASECPKCGTCACDRDTTRRAMCDGCTATVRVDQLVDGLCSGCR